MDNEITTSLTLSNLLEVEQEEHQLKEMALLLLEAMNDWPFNADNNIAAFIKELKGYFGTPLTINAIRSKKFDGQNGWLVESGHSIETLIDISTQRDQEPDLHKIVTRILTHYNEAFRQVDFVAELNYLRTEEGGRLTPAKSGYRPQVKFDFTAMQTSGQQLFLNREIAFPGDTIEAKIKIASPDYFAGCLSEGMVFEFCEGPRTVGRGCVKYIVNDRLEKR